MKVIVEAGREQGQVIARIGGVIALFPKRERNPAIGSEVEVMITGYKVADNVEDQRLASPRLYFIRLVREDDRLISHDGFEMFGSMCTTTAHPVHRVANDWISFLTPGRVNPYVAENVNTGRSGLRYPRVAGLAYVKNERGARRIEGVPNIEQLEFWQFQNNPRVREVYDANKKAYAEWLEQISQEAKARKERAAQAQSN